MLLVAVGSYCSIVHVNCKQGTLSCHQQRLKTENENWESKNRLRPCPRYVECKQDTRNFQCEPTSEMISKERTMSIEFITAIK